MAVSRASGRVQARRGPRDVTQLAGLRVGLYCRASEDAQGTEKSVDDQEGVGRVWVARNECVLAGVYADNDRSASRFATKAREEFTRLVEDLQAGKLDVLWLWELSRSQRRLGVFAELRDLCRELGVLWVVSGRVYDLSNYMDVASLGFFAVHGEVEAELISERVRRGLASNAAGGRPHGQVTYGYRRVYDERSKAFLRQELDVELRTAVGRDGTVTEFSPAGVVREIYDRIGKGESTTRVTNSLIDRGVPSPRGKVWQRVHLRRLALNPAYAGKRVHQGEIVGDGQWPALVDEETFWAVHRTLTDPARTTWRPGRAKYLLSRLITCGKCGGQVTVGKVSRHGWEAKIYGCHLHRCAVMKVEHLDEYVERVIVAWLSTPAVYQALAAGHDDQEVAAARAEADRLRVELEQWRQLAEQREVSAVSFARAEKGLLAGIAEAEHRAETAGLPPVLRDLIGPDAARRWAERTVEAKREVVRLVADLTLMPVGRGVRRVGRDRVVWRWRLGPDIELDAA